MVYGYARVSTKGQAKDGNSLEAQETQLRENGATVIFKDAFTGKTTRRPQFDKLLKQLQPKDTLVVTKLDRVARSASQGILLIDELLDRGIRIHILNMGLLNNSSNGKLIRNIMLAFAEFERDMIVERTQEGKAIARQNKNYREGRPLKYSASNMEHALELLETHSYNQVADMTGISRSTLIRAVRRKKKEEI